MDVKLLCPSCRHNVPGGYVINVGNGYTCMRYIREFPTATECRDFEREPGAD
jgi:hypothetical protein